MLYKTSAKKMLRNGGFYEEKDTILVKPGAYRHLFYFDHFEKMHNFCASPVIYDNTK